MRHLEYYNSYSFLYESIKNARSILSNDEILDRILEIDPTRTKKYSGWIAKNYKRNQWDDDQFVKEIITKYDNLVARKKIERSDINSFNSISDLDNYIRDIEKNTSLSNKESRLNYDVILDNSEVLIVLPKSHDAARKLGMTTFSTGINPQTGAPDCRWCITYGNPDNWIENFYFDLSTYYLVNLKNEDYPNDKIAIGIRPVMENRKIKYPIETNIYYFDSTDNAINRRGEVYNPDWMDEHLIKIDNIINKYNIKNLLKPAYLKERFLSEEFKNYLLK